MLQPKYILIYDDRCALCAWYSGVFVKLGLLNGMHRAGFGEVAPAVLLHIDLDRAGNEIPLYNTHTHEVLYGIDALVAVLSHRLPWVKTIAQYQAVNYVLRKLYKLISYNRKGIVAHIPSAHGYECAPGYSYNYKKFFIVQCYFFCCIMLTTVHATALAYTAQWLYLLSGFIVLYAVLTTSKAYLEFAMQWQLVVLLGLVVLIPYTLLLPHISLAALFYGLFALIFIFVQVRNRLKYLLHYWRTL